MLHDRIDETSIDLVKQDLLPFVPDAMQLHTWWQNYFHDLADNMRVE
jgi:hypothetical protein